jgi:hypothetical protein
LTPILLLNINNDLADLTNVGNYIVSDNIKYRKVGSICEVTIIADGTFSAGTVLGTLPEGYRPSDGVNFANGNCDVRIAISTNGQVTTSVASTTAIRAHHLFFVG